MSDNPQLAAGTYEVLRHRLRAAADSLRERIKQLNQSRSDVFGNIVTTLLETSRITTEHNCIPRDLTTIGPHVLLGFNITFGLRSITHPSDVFAVYRFAEDGQLHADAVELLDDEQFARDFADLYRYYKHTTFAQFFEAEGFLYMLFSTGKGERDFKAFKWHREGERLRYLDNRSDQEVRLPPQHDFEWTRTHRDLHQAGPHPHISIEDIVFVECVGGDLTIKIENNTETGQGIYSEPVENPDQTLDDAEILYSRLGNLVLLRVRPYQERDYRHLVYNAKLKTAMRLDALADACILLPDNQGIIFSGGYYLQTGQHKLFDHGLSDLRYLRTLPSPNGEDYLYLFYNPFSGAYVQLRYNVIRQEVDTPLVCHGQAFFADGRMLCFRGPDDPQRHHAVQLWQTPFTSPNLVPEQQTDSRLFKIGNKELVRGMAECSELLGLLDKDESYTGLYVDVAKKAGDILDSYFWIADEETHRLDEPLKTVRDTAGAAIEEFEKVVRVQRETAQRTTEVEQTATELRKRLERTRFEEVADFVRALADLRSLRGAAIGLKDLRYVDLERVSAIEQAAIEQAERISHRCVQFLLNPQALDPYRQQVAELGNRIDSVETVAEAGKLDEEINGAATDLELLTETVSNLKIEDTTKRTAIIDAISDVLSSLNRVRSKLKARRNDLASAEGQAEFAAQMRLFSQSLSGYLELCDTPEKCDQYLTKAMVSLEELEGRFAEFDQFLEPLANEREQAYAAFESRKVQLVEARNRRAESLTQAAERILAGIQSRANAMDTIEAIHSYFAADLMVGKVRDIAAQLLELGDSVRSDDLTGRLKSVAEDAVRQLKDRNELFADGDNVIRFGRHQFNVNTQPLDLTTVPRGGMLNLHLTGTQYFEPLVAPELSEARDLWDEPLVSENQRVYRGEYLAWQCLKELERQQSSWEKRTPAKKLELVRSVMTKRLNEGYAKGVHDSDAVQIIDAIRSLDASAGLLKHPPGVRAAGWFLWTRILNDNARAPLERWIAGFAGLAQAFPDAQPSLALRTSLRQKYEQAEVMQSLFSEIDPAQAADYLFEQLVGLAEKQAQGPPVDGGRVVSGRAADLHRALLEHLTADQRDKLLGRGLEMADSQPAEALWLARHWVDAFLQQSDAQPKNAAPVLDPDRDYADEVALLLLEGVPAVERIQRSSPVVRLDSLAGAHHRIQQGAMHLSLHDYHERLGSHEAEYVPRFTAFQQAKHRLLEEARQRMRLEEFKPHVLSSFVRNRLIDEVYLPLIGDNLAKQIGTAGDSKRTDRMGLLLVISPPGYGKTTLMEYIANRLGIVFVKINGPAIGHAVTSLDPAEAPNAAAREEVQRLNLALRMGDNVMIYVDDIQHCNAELLQKFISLCDATRRIEGVWKGNSETYDLRGRKVAVVMAGNPYTESGERFQIPDMLANRADVYNLGEVIGASADAFEMSYLENCLTNNAVLAPLARTSAKDIRTMIRAATRGQADLVELESSLPADQVREMYEVMVKLVRVRDIVLRINRAYIHSAAQSEAARTEPPFQLQGSYRNMNRIAERVVPVMNDAELMQLVDTAYEQDAGTLTTGTEANMLKYKELVGRLTAAEAERWQAVKYAFVESQRFAGLDAGDQAAQVMAHLSSLRDGLEMIRRAIVQAIAHQASDTQEEALHSEARRIATALTDVGTQIQTALAATAEELQSLRRQQAVLPEQKVLVQHKVPRVMLNVVRNQFQLMQSWLQPLGEESMHTRAQLQQLSERIGACLEDYRRLQEELDQAAGS